MRGCCSASSRAFSARPAGRPAGRRTPCPPSAMPPWSAGWCGEELDQQNRGGQVQRFFNRPIVLVPLFLPVVALLIWLLWPTSPERQYQRGVHLMESNDPDDWETGWTEHLGAPAPASPDFHADEVAAFKAKAEGVRRAPPGTSRLRTEPCRRGRPSGSIRRVCVCVSSARRTRLGRNGRPWSTPSAAVPSEAPWVGKAEDRLAEKRRSAERNEIWGLSNRHRAGGPAAQGRQGGGGASVSSAACGNCIRNEGSMIWRAGLRQRPEYIIGDNRGRLPYRAYSLGA